MVLQLICAVFEGQILIYNYIIIVITYCCYFIIVLYVWEIHWRSFKAYNKFLLSLQQAEFIHILRFIFLLFMHVWGKAENWAGDFWDI